MTAGDDTPIEAPTSTAVGNTCTGTFPSYWQDPAPKFKDQWHGQSITNAPPEAWPGPVFKLSDKFPDKPVDDKDAQPWRDAKFDALFADGTPADARTALAREYGWAVMRYMQAGNIGRDGQEDWDVCDNPVRPWYHIPFQTYEPLSGREFTHGLTREAPVKFSIKPSPGTVKSTMWAVAVYNATAAATLGEVWKADGTAVPPTKDLSFAEGAVIGKPLFNTATPGELPVLENMPTWHANISDPVFCPCTPAKGKTCTLVERSQQCPRNTKTWGPVRLLQFDFAIKDSRARGTQWVYGTFVADGQRKAKEPNPWNRISLLGVMWGNDTPPVGEHASLSPSDPKANGFKEEVIFWDVVAMLNDAGGEAEDLLPGHLGCNSRLNGPADDPSSSCLSCHGTASVPDKNLAVPPLLSQFSGSPQTVTSQCVTPKQGSPNQGSDHSGKPATSINGVTFSEIDALYFANTPAATAFNATASTSAGPKNVFGKGVPTYADGDRTSWISLDYSLQLSISLTQWGQWLEHKQGDPAAARVHVKLMRRKE